MVLVQPVSQAGRAGAPCQESVSRYPASVGLLVAGGSVWGVGRVFGFASVVRGSTVQKGNVDRAKG